MQTRLQVTHVEIVSIMKQTYEVFKHDGQEVLWIVVLDVKCKDFYHWKKLKGLFGKGNAGLFVFSILFGRCKPIGCATLRKWIVWLKRHSD